MKFNNFLFSVFVISIVSTFCSCSELKTVDKSYLNSMAMSLDQNRTPSFIGRGITLNANAVGSQTACTTCSK